MMGGRNALTFKTFLADFESRSIKTSIRSIPPLQWVGGVASAEVNCSFGSFPAFVLVIAKLNEDLPIGKLHKKESLPSVVAALGTVRFLGVTVHCFKTIPAFSCTRISVIIERYTPFSYGADTYRRYRQRLAQPNCYFQVNNLSLLSLLTLNAFLRFEVPQTCMLVTTTNATRCAAIP